MLLRKNVLIGLLLHAALSAALACGSLASHERPAQQSDKSVKPLIVFDGDKLGANAKGWADPADKSSVALQDKEVHTPGHKAVAFHGKGQGWMGGGWNWFGWTPEDAGTDTTPYKSLRLWAKLSGDKLPGTFNLILKSSDKDKAKQESRSGNLYKYCESIKDGQWHQVTIPLADLYNGTQANRAKASELEFGVWAQEDADFTLYVAEIAFEGKGEAPPDATAAPLPKAVDAADANVRYLGRWDMSNPHAPRASWTCCSVLAKFQGTAINAVFKGGGYYQVVVDGKPTRVVGPKGEAAVYALASGLPAGAHTVELMRRNEANWVDPIVFSGFQIEKDAKLLPLPARSIRRLLVIGDSITCGYGNEAQMDEGNPLDKENAYLTYEAIASRKLGAELQVLSWSGRKLYPNNTMVELYDRVLGMDENPKADLKGWVPGVVLIDLGTNDFGDRNHMPDKDGWINAYKGFIHTIRQTAPNAYVFVASGPMGTAQEWDSWAKTIVGDLRVAGDTRIAYLPFPTQDVQGDGVGGHWHPNLKTHAKMADLLVSEVEKAVGWRSVQGK